MKKIVFGSLVLLAGLLLMGFNLGFLPIEYKHIVFSWQMLLIAIGLVNVFSRDSWFLGLMLILTGGFFLATNLLMLPINVKALLVPSLLIIIGMSIIFKRVNKKTWHKKAHFEYTTKDGFIEEVNIFGGSKQKIAPMEFRGGKITNIFGGTELDFTSTTLAEGTNLLEVTCVFGGVVLIIPSDWIVKLEMASIMGGFADKRISSGKIIEGNKRELIIKGTVVFGGGEIKSYV